LADNILFRSNKLGIKSKKFVQEQRYLMSNKVINKYMWITGGVILVNPLPAVDFLTTTSVNLQMIMELSKIYEIKLTKKDAKDLSKSLLSALAKQGILKGGLSIISNKSNKIKGPIWKSNIDRNIYINISNNYSKVEKFKLLEEEELFKESERLIYVALTRSKYKLIVFNDLEDTNNILNNDLLNNLENILT